MPHEHLLVSEVAVKARVGEKTIRRWCQEGLLPSKKVGKHYLIKATDACALLEVSTGDGDARNLKGPDVAA